MSDLYSVDFRDIVTYEKKIFFGELPLEEDDDPNEIFNVQINNAVSANCEKVIYHWYVMKNIYGHAGEVLSAKLASLLRLNTKDLFALRGCSAVGIEELIFDLEVLKFYFDPEKASDKYSESSNLIYSENLSLVFNALVNGITGIELPEMPYDNLPCAIAILQEFLEANRNNRDFRNNFLIYKTTLHKKCMSMAQFIAFLNANSNILCIRPGSISKSLHSKVTSHDGRTLSAEVGHGFVDFFGVDMGEMLPEDPELREQEVLNRLHLAYNIRKQSASYDIKDIINVLLDMAKGQPIRTYIWELKVLNDGATPKEMGDYHTQVAGYVQKLQSALSATCVDESLIELLHGLVIVMPKEVKFYGNISSYMFNARLEEILKKLDSEATLFERPHFEERGGVEGIIGEGEEMDVDKVYVMNGSDESDANQVNEASEVDESDIDKVDEESYVEDELISEVPSVEPAGQIQMESLNLPETKIDNIQSWLNYQNSGTSMIETKDDGTRLFVNNNGFIWVNYGWSQEAIDEARAGGFNVQVTADNVLPPPHMSEDWELAFRFPRPWDSLIEMFRNEPKVINDTPNGKKELTLLAIKKNWAIRNGEMAFGRAKNFKEHREVLEERIEQPNKSKKRQRILKESHQPQLLGFDRSLNYEM